MQVSNYLSDQKQTWSWVVNNYMHWHHITNGYAVWLVESQSCDSCERIIMNKQRLPFVRRHASWQPCKQRQFCAGYRHQVQIWITQWNTAIADIRNCLLAVWCSLVRFGEILITQQRRWSWSWRNRHFHSSRYAALASSIEKVSA